MRREVKAEGHMRMKEQGDTMKGCGGWKRYWSMCRRMAEHGMREVETSS